MSAENIKKELRELNDKKEKLDVINSGKFKVKYCSDETLRDEAVKLKESTKVDNQIKGLSLELALNMDNPKNQKEILDQLKSKCQPAVLSQKNAGRKPYLPHIYLFGL